MIQLPSIVEVVRALENEANHPFARTVALFLSGDATWRVDEYLMGKWPGVCSVIEDEEPDGLDSNCLVGDVSGFARIAIVNATCNALELCGKLMGLEGADISDDEWDTGGPIIAGTDMEARQIALALGLDDAECFATIPEAAQELARSLGFQLAVRLAEGR